MVSLLYVGKLRRGRQSQTQLKSPKGREAMSPSIKAKEKRWVILGACGGGGGAACRSQAKGSAHFTPSGGRDFLTYADTGGPWRLARAGKTCLLSGGLLPAVCQAEHAHVTWGRRHTWPQAHRSMHTEAWAEHRKETSLCLRAEFWEFYKDARGYPLGEERKHLFYRWSPTHL